MPTTKHDIARFNKTRHKSTYHEWARYPSRRKGVPGASKRVIYTLTLTDKGPAKEPKLNHHSMYAEGLVKTNAGTMIAFLSEPCFVDSVNPVLIVLDRPL